MNTPIRSRIHLFVAITLLTNLVPLIRGEPTRGVDKSTRSHCVTRTPLINGPGWRGELHEPAVGPGICTIPNSGEPPIHATASGEPCKVSAPASTGIFGEPVQATRRLGLAGLGLMVSVLAAIWSRYHSMRRQCRYRGGVGTVASSLRACPDASPQEKHRHPPARYRVRRFDYDRFYLRMLRDL